MTKQDVTGIVAAFKSSPWPWVIGLVVVATVFVLKQDGRLDATETRLATVEEQVRVLSRNQDRLVADADTLKRRQELTMCALDPRVLQACGFYTLRARRP